MKKYKVSLAILQPKNYEVEIEAESEEEAIKLAIADYEDDGEGELVDFGADSFQDFKEETKSGIDVEEIKNE